MHITLEYLCSRFPNFKFTNPTKFCNKTIFITDGAEQEVIQLTEDIYNGAVPGWHAWYTPVFTYLTGETQNTKQIFLMETNDHLDILRKEKFTCELYTTRQIINKIRSWEEYVKLKIIAVDSSSILLKIKYDSIGLEKFVPEITDFCKDVWPDYGVKESHLIKELSIETISSIHRKDRKNIAVKDLKKYKEGIRETRESAMKCIADHIKKTDKVHLWWD